MGCAAAADAAAGAGEAPQRAHAVALQPGHAPCAHVEPACDLGARPRRARTDAGAQHEHATLESAQPAEAALQPADRLAQPPLATHPPDSAAPAGTPGCRSRHGDRRRACLRPSRRPTSRPTRRMTDRPPAHSRRSPRRPVTCPAGVPGRPELREGGSVRIAADLLGRWAAPGTAGSDTSGSRGTDGSVGTTSRTGSSTFGTVTVGTGGSPETPGRGSSAVADSALRSATATMANALTFLIPLFRFPQ